MREVGLVLLGPVRLRCAGELLPLDPSHLGVVLAALAVDAGQTVPTATLADRIAAGRPVGPALVHAQVESVRRALAAGDGPWEVGADGDGYALLGDEGAVDLHRFRLLVAAADDDALDDPHRADVLREALDLWRGPALADLTGPWVDDVRRALHGERDEVLARLARLRRTRPAEAPAAVAPAQLPLAVPGFVGRRAELAMLDALVDNPAEGTGTVAAIWGPPGIGKTVLAIGWAHRVAPRFPDGQLYLDLRGFDEEGRALDTTAAARSLLNGLGVAPDQIPGGVDAQLARYRSVLAGKRVLIVLDNAVTAEQVRPLLPGTAACRTVVTSRSELTSLVTLDGALPLTVPLFSAEEAQRLLVLRLGQARVREEAGAVNRLVERCAGLPLALAIAASYAASHPHHTLRSLVDDGADDLELFADSDPAADLRAVFSWSYRSLTPAAARLFRLVGLHSGPDVTVESCANLAGQSLAAVRPILSELTRASMLTEHRRGRFHMHALLRAYAVELLAVHDPPEQRHEALRRLLDYYLGASAAAASVLFPQLVPLSPPPPATGTTVPSIVDSDGATRWFGAEWETVVALVAIAAEQALPAHAWQLAVAVSNYLDRRGFRPEMLRTIEIGLAAAQAGDDELVVARMHRATALACIRVGRHDDATGHLRRALAIYGHEGNELHRAHTHSTLSISLEALGELQAALAEATRALQVFRHIGDALGEANALNSVGWIHGRLGEFDEAERYGREALGVFDRAGRTDLAGEASTWHTLGDALYHLRRYSEALVVYRESLRQYRQGGIRMFTARVLGNLGDTHLALDEPEQARMFWAESLAILREIDHADAEQVRAKLDQLDTRSPTAGPPHPAAAGEPARPDPRSPLTRRETEVARCVGQGLTNKQIARRLDISEWTVVNHMREIMRKLGCTSRVQVARWAWDALGREESSA